MSASPTNTASEWKETFENDFSTLEPGDLIEINQDIVVVMKTKEDVYGRKWIRITCDCEKNYLHMRPGWVTYSSGVDCKYFLTDEEGVEDKEPIEYFCIGRGAGKEELDEFSKMIWEDDLPDIPTGVKVFSEDQDYSAHETDVVTRVVASIKAETLPEDDILTLLVALNMIGCNLTPEQELLISRISYFMSNAFDEIMSSESEDGGVSQNILH